MEHGALLELVKISDTRKVLLSKTPSYISPNLRVALYLELRAVKTTLSPIFNAEDFSC